jgi:hypothetical protein
MLRDITAQTIQSNTDPIPCIRKRKNSKPTKKSVKRVKFDVEGIAWGLKLLINSDGGGKGSEGTDHCGAPNAQ